MAWVALARREGASFQVTLVPSHAVFVPGRLASSVRPVPLLLDYRSTAAAQVVLLQDAAVHRELRKSKKKKKKRQPNLGSDCQTSNSMLACGKTVVCCRAL